MDESDIFSLNMIFSSLKEFDAKFVMKFIALIVICITIKIHENLRVAFDGLNLWR